MIIYVGFSRVAEGKKLSIEQFLPRTIPPPVLGRTFTPWTIPLDILCIHTYTCMHKHTYTYIHTYTHTLYTHIHTHIHIHTYIHIQTYIYIHKHVCMQVYYVCMYYIYVFVCQNMSIYMTVYKCICIRA